MSGSAPRTVLIGAGPTALAAFESLLESTSVLCVFRQGDRRDPVAARAHAERVPVIDDLRPASVRKAVADLAPDCVAISSWDRIASPELLAVCPFVNVHYSPLPRYRGRANVNWAIINGEPEAAISIHEVVPGLDAGNILFQQAVPIGPDDTVAAIYSRLNDIQRERLGPTVRAFLNGFRGEPQREAGATYCCARLPEDGEIDWSAPARDIGRLVRALQPPYPYAYTFFDCRKLSVLRAAPVAAPPRYEGRIPGRVVGVNRGDGTVDVLTGDGILRLSEVAFEGEPPAAAASVASSTRHTLGLQPRQLLSKIQLLEARIEELAAAAAKSNRILVEEEQW